MKTAIIDVSIDCEAFDKYRDNTFFYVVHGDEVVPLSLDLNLRKGISHGEWSLKHYTIGAGRAADCFILLKKDKTQRCSVDDLVIALNWCMTSDVQLISLSLGTIEYTDAEKLWSMTKVLYDRGILIVAGASNEKLLSFPACFPHCLGVCIDHTYSSNLKTFSYQERTIDGIEIILSPFIVKNEFIDSNSSATAFFSGLIASREESREEVYKWLMFSSEQFHERNNFSYILSGIQEDFISDIPIIGIKDMSEPIQTKFWRKLQELFIRSEYHCLVIDSRNSFTHKENSVYRPCINFDNIDVSVTEQIELANKLCRPSIIFVEYSSSADDLVYDYLLCKSGDIYSDLPQIYMDKCSPQEAFTLLCDYFDN